MALVFVDSFDHYDTANVAQKWSATSGTNVIEAGGRSGKRLRSSGNAATVWLNVADRSTYVMGCGFSMTSFGGSSGFYIARFAEGNAHHVDLRVDAAGHLFVTRNGAVLGAAGSSTLSANTWYFIEFKATIHDSAGAVTVRLNGVDEIVLTGQDTRNANTGVINRLIVGHGDNSSATWFDDLYIVDTTGTSNNDFLGDVRVEALFPDGAGNSTQFTPDSGSNYARVNESAPDDDTSYVGSSTVGHKDTYAMGAMGASTSIKGTQQVIYARKTDAGSRVGRTVIRSGGTDYEGADIALTDTYLFHRTVRETDPNTSAAWTEAGVNGHEAGMKVQS